MRLAIVIGTRPEIIKMAPIMRKCEQLCIDYYVLHTGQHYDYDMDQIFFDQLQLGKPKYNLEIGSASHGIQTARIMEGVEKILSTEKQNFVLVQGDTNTVLAASLVASKMHIDLGHVEAGLRSYDRTMPEEINRITADHCSNLLFAPTERSKQVLLHEGIPLETVFNTGNTIVDAVNQNLAISHLAEKKLNEMGLESGKYFLLTLHRQENVDDPLRFKNIVRGLNLVFSKYGLPIVFPIHPRSRKMLVKFGIRPENLTLISPIDYLCFLHLEKNSRLIFTDSGGVQEEACILQVPCVTLRCNTERFETVEAGANVIAGTEPAEILRCTHNMVNKTGYWHNPFGDGSSSQKIIDILEEKNS